MPGGALFRWPSSKCAISIMASAGFLFQSRRLSSALESAKCVVLNAWVKSCHSILIRPGRGPISSIGTHMTVARTRKDSAASNHVILTLSNDTPIGPWDLAGPKAISHVVGRPPPRPPTCDACLGSAGPAWVRNRVASESNVKSDIYPIGRAEALAVAESQCRYQLVRQSPILVGPGHRRRHMPPGVKCSAAAGEQVVDITQGQVAKRKGPAEAGPKLVAEVVGYATMAPPTLPARRPQSTQSTADARCDRDTAWLMM